MSDKIISLSDYRSRKKNTQKTADQDKSKDQRPVTGALIWLRCLQCDTLEYTATPAPYGRQHKCGTQVLEATVSLDLRAEFTVAVKNISVIRRLREQIKSHKVLSFLGNRESDPLTELELNEKIYVDRLVQAAGKPLDIYDIENEAELLNLVPGLAEQNPPGFLITPFRQNPLERFR